MDEISKSIETHYTQGVLLKRIFTALKRAGRDARELTPEILAPIDHLHTSGLNFTRMQTETVGVASGMHALDRPTKGVNSQRRLIGCI